MTSNEQPFAEIVEIPNVEELIDLAFRRASKAEVTFPKKSAPIDKARIREKARVSIVYQVISSRLGKLLRSFPSLEKIHPFYRELVEIATGVDKVKKSLKNIAKTQRLIKEIYVQIREEISKADTPDTCTKLRRSFYGRVASLLRDINDDLKLIKAVRDELKDLPTINFNEVKVVVAGYPGVGKSTLVSLISSAKPLIGKYPFTTKEVIVGHIKLDDERIQVIDTPGLLEKPVEKMKKEELKALNALKFLADIIVFIVDVAESCGFTIEQQYSLFKSLAKYIERGDKIIVLNKIDLAKEDQIMKAKEIFGEDVLQTSLLKKVGVKEVVDRLLSLSKTYTIN